MVAPRVSIGLPVYNGERYLRGALDSLRAQDYGDFELIISDNASTDRTAEICQQCANSDERVRFVRNDRNLGAVANFNNVFRLSSGEYFMWAAHDDIWHPSYIRRCLEGLQRGANIVLCTSAIQFIDEFGSQMPEGRWRHYLGGGYNRLDTRSLALRDRLRRLTKRLNWFALYGIVKSDALRQTRLYPEGFGGDVVLLMELLFQGETLILDETLFFYRLLPKTAAAEGTVPGKRIGPYTELAVNLLHTIEKAPFAPEVKRNLREDLLENVSLNNPVWVDLILRENPSVARTSEPYARSAHVRELLTRLSSGGAPVWRGPGSTAPA